MGSGYGKMGKMGGKHQEIRTKDRLSDVKYPNHVVLQPPSICVQGGIRRYLFPALQIPDLWIRPGCPETLARPH